jgi:hypothetical protein
MDALTRISLKGETPTGGATDSEGSTRDFADWVGLVPASDGLRLYRPAGCSTMEEGSQ